LIQAADKFPHLVIRASAGTGKTYQLSNRYIALLFEDVAPDSILASTFTRKAAGEILDRVVLRLAEAVDDQQKRELLAAEVIRRPLTRGECLQKLAEVARSLHRMRVGTLDSFFSQIARSFSFEIGLSPAWQIVDELEDSRIRSEAIEAVLRRNDKKDLLSLTHLLTKGEATRGVGQLIRSTVDQLYNIYQDTQPDPQPWHSIARLPQLSPDQLTEVFDQLSILKMPTNQFDEARHKDLSAASDGDWGTFISKGIAAKVLAGEPKYNRREIPEDAVALYSQLLKHAQAELIGNIISQTEATHDLLEKFHVEYQRLKQQRQAVRFEDVTRTLAGSEALNDVQRLVFRLDADITHLLLDEFQDTSPSQWGVIRNFASRATAAGETGSGNDGNPAAPGGSFFCVGDVKQAIYGWRGGVAEIFDTISHEIPGLQTQALNVSYRSSQAVVDTVNQVFAGIGLHTNLDRFEEAVKRWCSKVEPHSTALKKLNGYTTLESSPAKSEDGKPLEAAFDYAAQRVADIVQQAPGFSVGVLVRRNASVGQLIYRLRALGVAASEEGGNPLTDSAAVLACISLLKLSDHPGDGVFRFHVANSVLGKAYGFQNLAFNRESQEQDNQAAGQLAQQVRRELLTEGYGAVLQRWAEILAPECTPRELSRTLQLVELAYDYQSRATLRASDFTAFVEHQRVSDPSTAAVRVMTVHQSKGLEFDVVVLPELTADFTGQHDQFVVHKDSPTAPVTRVCRYANAAVQPLLPPAVQQMFADSNDRAAVESLCVIYVALTRAVHALHMIIPPTDGNEWKMPRTFAGLLRAALCEKGRVEPNQLLFQHGDPKWFENPGTSKTPQEETADASGPPVEVKLAEVPSTGKVLRQRPPSRLGGGDLVTLQDVLPGAGAIALRQGVIFHAWFEQIQWLDDGRPNDKTLQRHAMRIGAQSVNIPAMIKSFDEMLANRTVSRTLHRTRYDDWQPAGVSAAKLQGHSNQVDVWRERGFSVQDNGELLTGSIDRLVVLRRGSEILAADVVDFKTDFIESEDLLPARIDYYRPQMHAYRRAAAAMLRLPLERITSRLLFVSAGAEAVL